MDAPSTSYSAPTDGAIGARVCAAARSASPHRAPAQASIPNAAHHAAAVVVIDPRAVLEGRAADVKSVTLRGVPPALMPLLSKVRRVRPVRLHGCAPLGLNNFLWRDVS